MRATGTSGLQEHQGYRNIRATGTSGLQEHQGYRNIRATGTSGLQEHGGVRGELPFPPFIDRMSQMHLIVNLDSFLI